MSEQDGDKTDADVLLQRLLPALAQMAPERSAEAMRDAVVLLRDFPAWAIWLPDHAGTWIAARPASNRPPGPEVPMLWVTSPTSGGLADRMSAAEAGLQRG